MYPIERYRYYVQENKNGTNVIAVTTYAGKTVRGIAKCHPNDTFDLETGKKIAAARCAVKVAQKREARARNEYNKAFRATEAAKARESKMWNYREDASIEVNNAVEYLNSLF